MLTGSKLKRNSDGKIFVCFCLAHWSDIIASDREEDTVKWYGGGSDGEYYASNSKGHSYILIR